MCPPMWAHWRHLANMIEIVHTGATWRIRLNLLVLPSAHPSPQPKRQIDWFCRAHRQNAESPFTLQRVTLSQKNAPSHGGSGPPSNTLLLGPIQAHNPIGISIGSAVFAQMTAVCPYTLQWDAPFPSQNCPLPWGIWTPSIIIIIIIINIDV